MSNQEADSAENGADQGKSAQTAFGAIAGGVNPNLILGISVLILLVFGGLVAYMMNSATVGDGTVWDRRLLIFNSVEAIAFAAAGFIFGREVNRQQAISAEKRAEEAVKEANQSGKEAAEAKAKGKSITAAIEAQTQMRSDDDEVESLGIEKSIPEANQNMASLYYLAKQLFPDA